MDRYERHLEALGRRIAYLDLQLEDEGDGAMMYARRERAAIRYLLGIVEQLREDDDMAFSAVQVHAFRNGRVAFSDLTKNARSLLDRLGVRKAS